MADSAIILASAEHAELLGDEFGRYRRDYDVHAVRSAADGLSVAQRIRSAGGQVAMFVADSRLPDAHVLEAFANWRALVANARRLVVAHWDHFLTDAEPLRAGLAKGECDAYLLMPGEVRDEEFHNAVTDLLSDWCSTVAAPEADTVRIVTPRWTAARCTWRSSPTVSRS